MYQKSILPNGIRVVSQVIPNAKSVAAGVWVGTGARREQAENHGISHFIEHLMFKGTETQTSGEIAEKVDAVGGELNAFTTKEYTCYHIKVLDSQLEFAFSLLSDMLLASKFAEIDIEREREVVLEEIYMYEDTPDELAFDLHLDAVWEGHSLGRNILGTANSLYNFNRPMVFDYYQKNYVPENMVIAIAGNFVHSKVMEYAYRYFAGCQGLLGQKTQEPPIYKPVRSINAKELEQVHLCLSFPGVRQNSPEVYITHVLNNIIGGSASSRLFQAIREERGLAYSIYSFEISHSDVGLFSIYAGTRPGNARQVTQLILENLADLKEKGIYERELQKAKEQAKGNLILGLESTCSWMTRLGKLELVYGKYPSLEEVLKRIDKVKIAEADAMLQKIFKTENLGFSALGPVGEKLLDAVTGI